MPRAILVVLLLCVLAAVIPAAGQAGAAAQPATAGDAATSAAPKTPPNSPRIEHPGVGKETNTPDMVCFGYYPRWSVQFGNGEARYLGYNESDRYFDGDFYWVSDENAWEWRHDGAVVSSGHYGLSATIERTECKDPVQKTINPYSAEVYLPEGDMVSGCCRKLKPGEAPIGRHGAPASAVASGAPAPPAPPTQAAAPASNKTPVAGHPVDQY